MRMPIELVKHLGEHAQRMQEFVSEDYSGLNDKERSELASEARNISAWAAGAIAPMPIPFADIWTITPVQMFMVRAIGNIYGYKIDKKTIKEVFAVVGGGIVGQQVCLALFKIGLPGAGGFGGAAFVWVWTHGMGHAAERYFQSGMKATKEQVEEARKNGMELAKQEQELQKDDV